MGAVSMRLADGITRIELESERPIRFSLFALRNPERVLVDLDGVELDQVLAALPARLRADHPYIRAIRVRRTRPDTVRIEIDLREEVEPRVFALPARGARRGRLVLEMQPEKAPDPAPVARAPAAAPAPPVAPRPTMPPAPAREALETEEALLAISVNRQPMRTTVVLRRADGAVLMPGEELTKWRLRHPQGPPVLKDGVAYYPLEALRGLSYQIDAPSQALLIEASPGAFEATALRGAATAFSTPPPPPLGGFVNYDLFADRAQRRTAASALVELGAFGPWGAGVSNFAGRELDGRFRVVRLETTWTQDRPAELASLRVGDAIGRAGSWGRAVRFGGIQWSTNFGTQPAFIAFPLPGLAGEAVLPSTVDLFVNDTLRLRREVPAGPFSIHDLPVITGRGEARLVVRDVLGREHVITQPYYASPRLLQKGLHDYSYEMGLVRENFGLESNDYGRHFAAATHRFGVSDRFTVEARGEAARGQGALGLAGVYLWPRVGVASASVAASRSERGGGRSLALGFEHQSRRLSFGASTQMATRHFSQLGLLPGERAPRHVSQAFVGLAAGGLGSMTLGYTHQDHRDREDIAFLSASYGITLGKLGFLSLSVTRFLTGIEDTFIGLTFTRPLDGRTSASAGATRQSGSTQGTVQIQRSLPSGSGYGYRAAAAFPDPSRLEAGVALQSEIGTYTLDAARLDGRTAYRAAASGGVAALGGGIFPSRRINESFAMVNVPGYSGVRVYADNQLIGRTSAAGNALVPRLVPYGRTSVRIEPADLPLDAEISAMQLEATPYFRSGQVLSFAVRRSRGAMFTVVLADGSPLPAGAMVRIAGNNAEFPVGLRGETYMTDLAEKNRVIASWRGQSCEFIVALRDTTEILPHLGAFTCAGVKP